MSIWPFVTHHRGMKSWCYDSLCHLVPRIFGIVYIVMNYIHLFIIAISVILSHLMRLYLRKRIHFLQQNPLSISDFPPRVDRVTFLQVMLEKKYGYSIDHWIKVKELPFLSSHFSFFLYPVDLWWNGWSWWRRCSRSRGFSLLSSLPLLPFFCPCQASSPVGYSRVYWNWKFSKRGSTCGLLLCIVTEFQIFSFRFRRKETANLRLYFPLHSLR